MNIYVIHFVSTLGSEVNTIDKCLLPFFHHCSLPYITSLLPSLFSYLCLVPFPLLSLLHSTCLLSSLTFFPSLSPSFPHEVKFPHSSSPTSPTSFFYPLSLLSPLLLHSATFSIPIPTKPLYKHTLFYSLFCSLFDKQFTQFFKCLF